MLNHETREYSYAFAEPRSIGRRRPRRHEKRITRFEIKSLPHAESRLGKPIGLAHACFSPIVILRSRFKALREPRPTEYGPPTPSCSADH
jgi:hypothetical protein